MAPVLDESGRYHGAFAEYLLDREDRLVAVPPGVSLRAAALTEPLPVALHGLTQGGVRAGHRVLVTGAGPIGTLSIAAARARGVTDVVVSEPHLKRRALAEQLGAVAVTPDTLVVPDFPGAVVDDPFTDLLIEPDDVPLDGNLEAIKQLGAGERPGEVMIVPPRATV